MITKDKLRKRLAAMGVLTFALGVAGISMGSQEVSAAPAKQFQTASTDPQALTPIPYFLPQSSWAQQQLFLPQQQQLFLPQQQQQLILPQQQQQLILPQQQQQLILPQQQQQLNQALLQNALYNDLAFQGAPLKNSAAVTASNEFVLD